MPTLPPDSFTSIPPGIAHSVSPPGAGMGGPPGVGPQTGAPIDPAMLAQLGASKAGEMPDLFQRVAMLMQQDPQWILIMAGLGLSQALEKSGKYESKPHRSNQEISATGQPVPNQGQTGMQTPDQMMQGSMPSIPQGGM